VIAAANPDLRLLPGMTASLTLETARVSSVVKLPTAALRFRPTSAMFRAFGQPLPQGRVSTATAVAGPGAASASRPVEAVASGARSHAMIDEFFQPLAPIRTRAEAWTMKNGKLSAAPLEVGGSDGTWTELLSGDVHPGDELITGITVAPATR
jgi:HlyD family secretion protein